jgi:AcrR family transcriptional regulator
MNEQQWLEELLKENDQEVKLSEKQVNILKAAIEMFAEKGYASTSTSEIAKRAGVAEGTIFRHYKTKKDLLISIVSPVMTKVIVPFFARNIVKDIFDQKYQSYEDFIRALIWNRYEFAKTYLPIIKIIIQEMAFHPEIKETYQMVFQQHVWPKFLEIVKYFQRKGELVELPSETIIRFTMTTIIGFFMTRFIIAPEQNWDDEKEIEHTVQLLMNGLKNK